jgi:nicotinamidase-related amidase
MQYGDAHPDYGVVRARREEGDEAGVAYYCRRLTDVAVPNLQRLQLACRTAGVEVIQAKIASLTHDGRDRSLQHVRMGLHFPPGTREADILDELAPLPDEIVLSKTCSSVFNGTNIEYILRNLGIHNLIVGGVSTGSCVEMAVRDAADRGFTVILAEDATASWSAEMQAAAVLAMSERAAKVKTTEQVLAMLEKLAE